MLEAQKVSKRWEKELKAPWVSSDGRYCCQPQTFVLPGFRCSYDCVTDQIIANQKWKRAKFNGRSMGKHTEDQWQRVLEKENSSKHCTIDKTLPSNIIISAASNYQGKTFIWDPLAHIRNRWQFNREQKKKKTSNFEIVSKRPAW